MSPKNTIAYPEYLVVLMVVLAIAYLVQFSPALPPNPSPSPTGSYPPPTSSPTPPPSGSPSPTSTPSPSPSPSPSTPPLGPNLAIIPNDWGNYNPSNWIAYGSGTQIVFLSTSVERTVGHPSIWFEYPHTSGDMNVAREVDGKWYDINPGDHIVAKCWMKLTASGFGDTNPYSGARIGIDFYDTGIIPFASFWLNYYGGDWSKSYVHWGSDWTQKTIDIVVPAKDADTNRVPTSFVVWMQIWSSTYFATDPGQGWFADAELYINP